MKTIDIINDSGFYKDKDPQLLTDGEIELSVNLPPVSGEYYFIGKNNGTLLGKQKIASGVPFRLSDIKAGVLTAAVGHYLHGELIELFPVEGLLLKDVDGKVCGVPEIESLKSELASAEKRIQALEDKNKTFMQVVDNLNKRLKNIEKSIREGE